VITANEVRQVMASGQLDGVTQPDDIDFAGAQQPTGGIPPLTTQGPAGEPFCPPPPAALLAVGCTDPNGALQTSVDANRPVELPASRSYPARFGHDQFYGYGRAQMERAVEALDPDSPTASPLVPPEVEIFSPQWYEQIDPASAALEVRGQVYARDRPFTCEVLVAPGHYPHNGVSPNGDFHEVAPAGGPCDGSTVHTGELDGALASVSIATLKTYFRSTPRGRTGRGASPASAFRPPTDGPIPTRTASSSRSWRRPATPIRWSRRASATMAATSR
jgi:hypothetical protein